MGILKDWQDDNDGICLKRKIVYFLSPSIWLRLHKYRKQRADRGWSDRDTWGAGDHIAQITAEMLQHLNDNTYVDWPDWFKYNVKEKGSYKNLQSVIDDINGYLNNQTISWADGLEIAEKDINEIFVEEGDHRVYKSPGYINIETGKKLTEKQISSLIKKYYDRESKLYKKSTDAMQFFGRHFSSFWD